MSQQRYAPNLQLAGHMHRRAYLSFLVTGEYREFCGTGRQECTPGTLIFHPEGESHSDSFASRGAVVLNLDVHDAAKVHDMRDMLLPCRSTIVGPARLLALQLYREARGEDPLSLLLVESLSLELLSNCCRFARNRGTPRWLGIVVEMANDRYADRLTLIEVAQAACVHPVHLARQFRRRMGCTFGEFVRRLRLARALSQLRQAYRSVAEIAVATGFADQSHLTRVMRRSIGISPAAYRRACRDS